MKIPLRRGRATPAALLLAVVLGMPLLHAGWPAADAAVPPPSPGGIAWQPASSDADIDQAFRLARQAGKPVFLYWGAVWCPPCNQVKATLFSRPDFIERTRAFIPVYVDGDKPGAQKIASRFKVAGYPTMVLFKPDGTELTRLPGEVDPERYLLALSAGLNAQVPVSELVRRALSHAALSPEQWRLLSYYAWDTDQDQVVREAALAGTLDRLAAAAPADLPRVRDRLTLKAVQARAVSAAGEGPSAPASPAHAAAPAPAVLEGDRVVVERLLADPEAPGALVDLFIYGGPEVVRYLAAGAAPRSALAARWDAALGGLMAGGRLSRTERVDALDARVDLWKMVDGMPRLSAQRQSAVREEVAQLVAGSTDRYERQSVVPSAAHVLSDAGLLAESDALIKAELPHAVAPYYHMLVLASNAKERGDKAAALQWYQEAWRKSEGPATRLQWGTNYIRNLVDLTPGDLKRIAAATQAVVGELAPVSETFFERNERALQRLVRSLQAWQGKDPARERILATVRMHLRQVCARLPAGDPGRTNCESVATVHSVRPAG